MQVKDVVAGKYVLQEQLGVGGMGVVFRARDRSLARTVALKFVRPELATDVEMRADLRREAMATARVSHHQVVSFVEYGEDDGQGFLAMAHVPGEPLGRLVARTGAMPFARARAIVDQLLSALVATHAEGVVHADVKSDNLLVSSEVTGDHATLIDFGLARIDDDVIGEPAGVVSGTPEYLAPELVHGELPSTASDLYGVGIILYELLAGTTPFAGGSSADVLARQCDDRAAPLADVCPDLRHARAIDVLIARALDKDPRTRICDAVAFRAALATIGQRSSTTADDGVGGPCEAREAVDAAIRHGDVDATIIAYIELAQQLVDEHRFTCAIRELERGLALVTDGAGVASRMPPAQLWRIVIALASVHARAGHHEVALDYTRGAMTLAKRSGSYSGHVRAATLLDSLRFVR